MSNYDNLSDVPLTGKALADFQKSLQSKTATKVASAPTVTPSKPTWQPDTDDSFWHNMNPRNPHGYLASTLGTPGSATEAAARGLANGMTLGLAPKASAAVRQFTNDEGSSYKDLENSEQNANASAMKDHPLAYVGGNIAGSLPAGAAVLRGASLAAAGREGIPALASMARGAGTVGAAEGAIQGFGGSASGVGAAQTAKDIGTQAAIGGLVNGAAVPLTSAISKQLTTRMAEKVQSVLSGDTPAASVSPQVQAVVQKLITPAVGGVGGVLLGHNSGVYDTDYPNDFWSSLAKDATAGAVGMAGTKALQVGSELAGNAASKAPDVLKSVASGAADAGKAVGSVANKALGGAPAWLADRYGPEAMQSFANGEGSSQGDQAFKTLLDHIGNKAPDAGLPESGPQNRYGFGTPGFPDDAKPIIGPSNIANKAGVSDAGQKLKDAYTQAAQADSTSQAAANARAQSAKTENFANAKMQQDDADKIFAGAQPKPVDLEVSPSVNTGPSAVYQQMRDQLPVRLGQPKMKESDIDALLSGVDPQITDPVQARQIVTKIVAGKRPDVLPQAPEGSDSTGTLSATPNADALQQALANIKPSSIGPSTQTMPSIPQSNSEAMAASASPEGRVAMKSGDLKSETADKVQTNLKAPITSMPDPAGDANLRNFFNGGNDDTSGFMMSPGKSLWDQVQGDTAAPATMPSPPSDAAARLARMNYLQATQQAAPELNAATGGYASKAGTGDPIADSAAQANNLRDMQRWAETSDFMKAKQAFADNPSSVNQQALQEAQSALNMRAFMAKLGSTGGTAPEMNIDPNQ